MWERLKTILIQLTQNNKTITFNVSINVDIYLIYTRHEMIGPHTVSVACFNEVVFHAVTEDGDNGEQILCY